MCRNIHTLFNYEPSATDEEVRDAAVQYVRKISGFTKPSQANEEAFARAVDEVTEVTRRLVDSLVTTAEPKDREVEAARPKARAARRFPPPQAGSAERTSPSASVGRSAGKTSSGSGNLRAAAAACFFSRLSLRFSSTACSRFRFAIVC